MHVLIRDPAKERAIFVNEVTDFYKQKLGSVFRVPFVGGKPVDLLGLYKTVTAFGGWLKVCSNNKWSDVMDKLKLPSDCGVAEHGIKLVYVRYLARFEAWKSGEDETENDESTVGSRGGAGAGNSRGNKHFLANFIPSRLSLQDSRGGHRRTFPLHDRHGRVMRSLQSGLPNEVDFALNVCTVLSTPGPRVLRLGKHPQIMDLLLAHVGIFDEGCTHFLRHLYTECWQKYSGHLFLKFWHESIEDEQIRDLLGSPEMPSDSPSLCALFNLNGRGLDSKDVLGQRIIQICSILRNLSFESFNVPIMASSKPLLKFLLACIHCGLPNLQALALDTLSNIAAAMQLDDVDCWTTQHLLRTLTKCLHSPDKFHSIRALEAITNLCLVSENEDVLITFLEDPVLERIMSLLAVKDIMLCVYLLECLYRVSEIGPVPTQRLAEIPKAIDTLVSLITVEAVAFGPNGLMGMKVVEYNLPGQQQQQRSVPPLPTMSRPIPVPVGPSRHPLPSPIGQARMVGTSQPAESLRRPAETNVMAHGASHGAFPSPAVSGSNLMQHQHQSTPVPLPPPATVSSYSAPLPTTTPVAATPTTIVPPSIPVSTGGEVPLISSAVVGALRSNPRQPTPPPTHTVAYRGPAVTVQQDDQAEQVALNWLGTHCSPDPSASTSRSELYAHYAGFVQQHQKGLIVSANTFANLIRQCFPACICHVPEQGIGKSSLMRIEGIRFQPRISPSTPAHTGLPNNQSTISATHSIGQSAINPAPLSSVGSAPHKPSPANGAIPSPGSHIQAQHPTVGRLLEAEGVAGAGSQAQPPPTTNGLPPKSAAPSSILAQRLTAGKVGANARIGSPAVGGPETPGSGPSDSLSCCSDMASAPSTPDSCCGGGSGGAVFAAASTAPATGCVAAPKRNRKGSTKNLPLKAEPTSSPPIGGKIPANCKIEVCEAAREAKTLLIGHSITHQANILRVENTLIPAGIDAESVTPLAGGDASVMTQLAPATGACMTPILRQKCGTMAAVISAGGEAGMAMVNGGGTKWSIPDPDDLDGMGPLPPPQSLVTKVVDHGHCDGESATVTAGGCPPISGGKMVLVPPATALAPHGLMNGDASPPNDAKKSSSKNEKIDLMLQSLVKQENMVDLPSVGLPNGLTAPLGSAGLHPGGTPNPTNPTPGAPSQPSTPSSHGTNKLTIKISPNHKSVVVNAPDAVEQHMEWTPSPGSTETSSSAISDEESRTMSPPLSVKPSEADATVGRRPSKPTKGRERGAGGEKRSPSPDCDSMRLNLNACQQSIQQLLHSAAVPLTGAASASAARSSASSQSKTATAGGTACPPPAITPACNGSLGGPGSPQTPAPATPALNGQMGGPETPGISGGPGFKNGGEVGPSDFEMADSQPVPTPNTKAKARAPRKRNADGAVTKTPAKRAKSRRPGSASSCASHAASDASRSAASPSTAVPITTIPPQPPTAPLTVPLSTPAGTPTLPPPATPTGGAGVVGRGGNFVPLHIQPPRPEQIMCRCEWADCGQEFWKASQMYFHVVKEHLARDDITTPCQWTHCDPTPRLRWSMITHVHDVHCNDRVLRLAAIRRYELSQCGVSNIAPPRSPPPHPGYAADAALSAIRRHACNYLPRDLTDENEGPVTKSLRLTSCLILRNVARYSSDGRRHLRKHESDLAYLALSKMESSTALAQLLAELTTRHTSPPPPPPAVTDDDTTSSMTCL